jgi:hypothetical protein
MALETNTATTRFHFRESGSSHECIVLVDTSRGLSGPNNIADWQAIVEEAFVFDTTAPWYVDRRSTTWTLTVVDTKANIAGLEYEFAEDFGIPGTAMLDTPPMNVSLVVAKITGLVGRQYRGRMIVPPMTLDQSTVDGAGYIDGGVLVTENVKYQDALGHLALHDLSMGVRHADGTITQLLNLDVRGRIGSIRRRFKR